MARQPWEPTEPTPEETEILQNAQIPTASRNPWELTEGERAQVRPEVRPLTRQEYRQRNPGTEGILGPFRYAAQGVPILGAFVPRTQASEDFGRTYPTAGALSRFGAGSAVYAPVARGVQIGARAAQNAIARQIGGVGARANPGLLTDMTSQAALGAGTNIGDIFARSNVPMSFDQSVIAGLLGAGSGAFGPLAGRVPGPSGVGNPIRVNPRTSRVIDSPEARELVSQVGPNRLMGIVTDARRTAAQPGHPFTFESELAHRLSRERTRLLGERTRDIVGDYVPGAVGAGLGFGLGGGSFMGGFLGGAAAHTGSRMVRRFANSPMGELYFGRQIRPWSAATINSLGPNFTMGLGREE